MENGPACQACGWVLRWLTEQNAWGCDRCRAVFPAQPQTPGAYAQHGQAPYAQPGQPYAQPGQAPYAQPGQPYAQPGQPYAQPGQAPYAQPGQAPYAQPGQAPYAQPGQPYAQPGQPYAQPGQPSHVAAGRPQPAAAPPQRNSSRKLWIAGGGVVVVAGVLIAIVVATRGSGGGGMSSGDALAKATVAALAKGDADALTKLGDPAAIESLIECKPDGGDDTTERKAKRLRERNEELVARTKGLALEIIDIKQRPPRVGADGKNRDAFEKGQKLGGRCTAKGPLVAHKIDVTLEAGSAGRTTMTIEAIEADGGWYLIDSIDLELPSSGAGGSAGLLAAATALKDRVCACKDKPCVDAVQLDMTRWSTEQAKAAANPGELDAAVTQELTAVMQAYSKCMSDVLAANAGSGAGTPRAAAAFAVGDWVMARWTNGSWYPGKIARVREDGTYDVAYDDGDYSRRLPASKVRKWTARSSSSKRSTSASDAPCPGPGITRRCNGVCVSIQDDSNNCGECGYRCPSGKTCHNLFCRDANGNL